jgi:hypothetical protein
MGLLLAEGNRLKHLKKDHVIKFHNMAAIISHKLHKENVVCGYFFALLYLCD